MWLGNMNNKLLCFQLFQNNFISYHESKKYLYGYNIYKIFIKQ